MTWQDRLEPFVTMVSPEGNRFEAKWQKSPRSMDKNLGIHTFPGTDGNVVQDLGSNSDRHSLQFFFDGPDHDLDAADFWAATRERGPWTTIHPVHGFMVLQLISGQENDDVVDAANTTEITSEWIEPIDEFTLTTAREYGALVENFSNETNATSAEQFDDEIMDFTQ
jgi:prophage DNA circulation protein